MPKVTRKGQVTIPKEMRDAVGLKPGTHVEFEVRDGECVLHKAVDEDRLTKWVGYLKKNRSQSTDQILGELRGESLELI